MRRKYMNGIHHNQNNGISIVREKEITRSQPDNSSIKCYSFFIHWHLLKSIKSNKEFSERFYGIIFEGKVLS